MAGAQGEAKLESLQELATLLKDLGDAGVPLKNEEARCCESETRV